MVEKNFVISIDKVKNEIMNSVKYFKEEIDEILNSKTKSLYEKYECTRILYREVYSALKAYQRLSDKYETNLFIFAQENINIIRDIKDYILEDILKQQGIKY